ncbi:uncharacterized protein LOC109789155 [Cajanus cajan]|uniref:uncharacterized protein LOC109789155 n=1 Tax=Cajanus cajan TaxID=3821 RepID=UPI00098DABA3|nr:uncharacterized protein LOC109789155 [Cajanus cajan]
MLQSQFLLPLSPSLTQTLHKPPLSLLPPLHHKPTILHSVSVSAIPPFLAQLANEADVEGPVELPFSSSIFATTDDPSPIQVASSVLLTGAISVFLFRSLRRRAQRVKQSQFRSSGEKKTIKEEALDSLKALGSASVEAKGPPSPGQALLGGVSAGIIALILYKFATTIEASLNRQTISDNYSVRQITITIRTIVNGLTYLATFVFGLNSLGLFLYSLQLGIKSIMEGSTESKSTDQSNSSIESPTDNSELSSRKEEQSSNDAQ